MPTDPLYLKLEHVSGGPLRVDFVAFDYNDSPVEPATWGRIKSLYR